MQLTNWQILSDRGPDLIACLDFPGARAAAGFAELAARTPLDACFLHLRQTTPGPLAACAAEWAAEFAATGRPVHAVLGYCSGAALATRLADALAAQGPTPAVVLFDAVPATGWLLVGEFFTAVGSSARHLTAVELADAHVLTQELMAKDPHDLPGIAAALAERYGQLMSAVGGRLSLPAPVYRQITAGFTAYLDYLLLAGEGGFDLRATTPLFVTSIDVEPPVAGARTLALDVGHDDLLREPKVHELVADIIRGERSC